MVDVNPEYGTLSDFDDLLKALNKSGIRVVMDYVPNHTSDKHDWFAKSCARDPKYENYYVWVDPKVNPDNSISPPNNWTGAFRGSMWTYHKGRKQMFLHQYLDGQPDLNYRSDDVVNDMKEVMNFWLKRGVAGFRMDTVATLAEDDSWADEPFNSQCGDPQDSSCYIHTKTTEQPLTYDTLRKFKQFLEDYAKSTDNIPRIMMTESWSNESTVLQRYYGTQDAQRTTFPFNFLCIMRMEVDQEDPAKKWADTINDWYSKVMPGPWAQPNLVLGNHDKHRFASRMTPEHSDIMNMVQLTLKGTALVYYGDELGLVNSIVRRDQAKDIQGIRAGPGKFYENSRDPGRNPMPWNNTVNGGFSTGNPWLPLASDYSLNNVASQLRAPTSHLKVFQALAKLRKTKTLIKGSCDVKNVDGSLIVWRSLNDNPSIVTVANLENRQQTVNLAEIRASMPQQMYIIVKSTNYLNNAM
ncbi:Maltase A3 [Nesidiocoris tenuis]|uniref:alpha-glucosidase n=1 Tax=Nesidiocoris tenuis TaxID=355587 RepID=A0ABN7AV98_9HEMI|nr:Maltase A3 [Nesidiocoris tenuis]